MGGVQSDWAGEGTGARSFWTYLTSTRQWGGGGKDGAGERAGRCCELDAFEYPGGVWLVAHSHVTVSVVTMLREISRVHFRWCAGGSAGWEGSTRGCRGGYKHHHLRQVVEKKENEDTECGGISGGAGSGGHGRPAPLVQYSTTQGCRRPTLSVVTRRPPLRPPHVRAASARFSIATRRSSSVLSSRAALQPAQQEERVSVLRE